MDVGDRRFVFGGDQHRLGGDTGIKGPGRVVGDPVGMMRNTSVPFISRGYCQRIVGMPFRMGYGGVTVLDIGHLQWCDMFHTVRNC